MLVSLLPAKKIVSGVEMLKDVLLPRFTPAFEVELKKQGLPLNPAVAYVNPDAPVREYEFELLSRIAVTVLLADSVIVLASAASNHRDNPEMEVGWNELLIPHFHAR